MDINLRENRRRKTPSFSSSLLDAIYRSIDESNVDEKREINRQREDEIPSLRRAIMIDKWIENRRNIVTISNSSSSDSIFSSETDSSKSKPKQTRSCGFSRSEKVKNFEQTPKRETRFMKTTKSRALKMYSDLKKAKQPISPGGRISSFLHSLFNSRNSKPNKKVDDSIRKSRSVKDSVTCSSVSPFSRSCLSNKTHSSGNGMKRSVRFYLDQEYRSCDKKIVYEDAKKNREKDRFRGFQVKNINRFEFREFEDDDSDDDEVGSCASSDLFELENIGPVGIGTYTEELPVYGTTSLRANLAIASGFIH